MKRIMLYYETGNRELEALMLLQKQLKAYGYSCLIANHGMAFLIKKIIKADLIATPWMRDDKNVVHFIKRDENVRLVDLQWEQVYSDRYLKNNFVNVKGAAKQTYHLCWGKNSYNRLNNQGVDVSKLRITGPMQLDICRQEFRELYITRKELADRFNLNINKKWILFISDFVFANYPKKYIQLQEKEFGINFNTNIEIGSKSQKDILNWYRVALNKYDNIEIIYRPHPSEFIADDVKQMERDCKGFHIIVDEPIKQWICNVNQVDTWMSTATVEAMAMGKEVNILRPFKIPDDMEMEIFRNIISIKTENEYLRQIYENSIKYNLNLENYYDVSEKEFSYKRVAREIKEIVEKESPTHFEINESVWNEDQLFFWKKVLALIYRTLATKTGIRLSRIFNIKNDGMVSADKWADVHKNDAPIKRKMKKFISEHPELFNEFD